MKEGKKKRKEGKIKKKASSSWDMCLSLWDGGREVLIDLNSQGSFMELRVKSIPCTPYYGKIRVLLKRK